MVFSTRIQTFLPVVAPKFFEVWCFLHRLIRFVHALLFWQTWLYFVCKSFMKRVNRVRARRACAFVLKCASWRGPKNFHLQRPQNFFQVWCVLQQLKNFHLQRPQHFHKYGIFYTDSKISTFSVPKMFPSMVFSTRTPKFPPSAVQKFFQVWCFLHRLKNFHLQRPQNVSKYGCFLLGLNLQLLQKCFQV